MKVSDKKDLIIVIILTLFAFFLRMHNLNAATAFSVDESMHVASAFNYTEKGLFGPDNWYHPPLKHLLLYGSISLFGNNHYGWRMRNVILGALSVIPFFYLIRHFTKGTSLPAISSLLYVTDPLHVLFSRSTFEDIPSVTFILTGMVLILLYHKQGKRPFLFSGCLSLGLSVCLRIYWLPVMMIIFAFSLLKTTRNHFLAPQLPGLISAFVFIPSFLYLFMYYPWFGRGYSLTEWFYMQIDAFREMISVRDFHPLLMQLRDPSRWFIKTVALGFNLGTDDASGRYVIIMNNIATWIFIPPSILTLFILSIKKRLFEGLAISLSFSILYMSFLITDRPIFLYTALSIIPFGFIAMAVTLGSLLKDRALWLYIPLIGWSLYLYPLTIATTVPHSLYEIVLKSMMLYRPLTW